MTSIAHQEFLERKYNKNQLKSRLKDELIQCTAIDILGSLKADNIPEDFGIDMMVSLMIYRKIHVSVLLGIANYHTDLTTASELLQKMVTEGYMTLLEGNVLESLFEVSQDVQQELDIFQYPFPFVIQPKKVEHNKMTGYYLSSGGSVILKNNHTEDDVVLGHLNRCNAVRLTVNLDTVQNTQNTWKGLAKRKPGETFADFKARQKQFLKWDSTIQSVIKELPERIYLTHRYDKRGRTYASGYHINYQGNDYSKAIVEFLNQEVCK